MDQSLLLFIIKLVLGGVAAFLAIFVMSKTRDASWMFLVAGFLFSYAALVVDLMMELGIFDRAALQIKGVPVIPLICAIVPTSLFIVAFIIKLCKKQ